jgi:hypothetical protein
MVLFWIGDAEDIVMDFFFSSGDGWGVLSYLSVWKRIDLSINYPLVQVERDMRGATVDGSQ